MPAYHYLLSLPAVAFFLILKKQNAEWCAAMENLFQIHPVESTVLTATL